MPLPVELHSSDPDAHERSRLAALHLSRVRLSDIEKQQVRTHAVHVRALPLSTACACPLCHAHVLTSLPLPWLFLFCVHVLRMQLLWAGKRSAASRGLGSAVQVHFDS